MHSSMVGRYSLSSAFGALFLLMGLFPWGLVVRESALVCVRPISVSLSMNIWCGEERKEATIWEKDSVALRPGWFADGNGGA